MKVWLDDEPTVEWRASLCPSPEWTHTRWPSDTISLLETGTVTHLSLDHDLADLYDAAKEGRRERTGYDVVLWIEQKVAQERFIPPEIRVHSLNGPGGDRIRAAIKQIQKYHQRNLESQT